MTSCADDSNPEHTATLEQPLIYALRNVDQIRGQFIAATLDTTDIDGGRRNVHAALLARSVGRVEAPAPRRWNPSGPNGPDCAAENDDFKSGSGFLTSDSQIASAHHVVYPTTFDYLENPCSIRVSFDATVPADPNASATHSHINRFLPWDPNNEVRQAGLEERTDNKCSGCNEENPLLANRLFVLGLERWAVDRNWGTGSTAVQESGYWRRAALRWRWPFRIDDRGATAFSIQEALHAQGKVNHLGDPANPSGNDLVFLTAQDCGHEDNIGPYAPVTLQTGEDDFPVTGQPIYSSDPASPAYTPSGPLGRLEKPAVFFNQVEMRAYSNGEGGPDAGLQAPAFAIHTNHWSDFTSNEVVPLISRPGVRWAHADGCADNNVEFCLDAGASGSSDDELGYGAIYRGCIEGTHDFAPGSSGGASLTLGWFAESWTLLLYASGVLQGSLTQACNSTTPCPEGTACINGWCAGSWLAPVVNANGNEDPQGQQFSAMMLTPVRDEACVNGICSVTPAECQTNGGCDSGQICHSGTCTIACTQNSDCLAGQACLDLLCVQQCAQDAECEDDVSWANRDFEGSGTWNDPKPYHPDGDGTPAGYDCARTDICDTARCGTSSGPLAHPMFGCPYGGNPPSPPPDFQSGAPAPPPSESTGSPQGAYSTFASSTCRFEWADDTVSEGAIVGFWGAEMEGERSGVGTLKMICAPWSSAPYTDNWRFLYFWGRTMGQPEDGRYYDALRTGYKWVNGTLVHALRYVMEQRPAPENWRYFRPMSAKMCPPGYYVNTLRGVHNGEYIVGLTELECIRTSKNRVSGGYLNTIIVRLATERTDLGKDAYDQFTMFSAPFSLDQRIGDPSGTWNIEWPCGENEALSGITFRGETGQPMRELWHECIKLP